MPMLQQLSLLSISILCLRAFHICMPAAEDLGYDSSTNISSIINSSSTNTASYDGSTNDSSIINSSITNTAAYTTAASSTEDASLVNQMLEQVWNGADIRARLCVRAWPLMNR